jgi:glycosyltransferase involved in cell wall biosynthesis
MKRPVLWVLSELYWPEENATGFLLTHIAEGLAHDFDVRVLCCPPNYFQRGTQVPRHETKNGVQIERVKGTSFNKDRLALRLINGLTMSLALFLRSLTRFRRGDRVLVVTNPPFLPFLTLAASRIKRAQCSLLVHDVYPEVLTAGGLAGRGSLLVIIGNALNRRLYRGMHSIITLGRDMQKLALQKLPKGDTRSVIIQNWADVELVKPMPRSSNPLLHELGLQNRFVVQYAGNLGRTHGVDTMLEAAKLLRSHTDIHFLVIGSGARRKALEQAVQSGELPNVTYLGTRPRTDQPVFLTACDLSLILFVPGMAGVSVPSRMYNVLAAATPILAACDDDSELAQVVREERVGWVVPPQNPAALAQAILAARDAEAERAEMALRARACVETKYTLRHALHKYRQLLSS